MRMQPPVHVPMTAPKPMSMPTPVFEEYEPAPDCVCAGCAQRRRAPAIPLRDGGHPAAHGARRALVVATAAGVVLGAGGSIAPAAANPPPAPIPGTGADPGPAAHGAAPDAGVALHPDSGPPHDTSPAHPSGSGSAASGSSPATPPASSGSASASGSGTASGTGSAAAASPGSGHSSGSGPAAGSGSGRPSGSGSAAASGSGSAPGDGSGSASGSGSGVAPASGVGAGQGSVPAPGGGPDRRPAVGASPEAGTGRGPGPSGHPAPEAPGSPQGSRGPLHGRPAPARPPGAPGAPSAVQRIDRTTIINRAKLWVDAKVPYSMSEYWSDGYRQDCSGYVSMAWNLGTNEWTGSLDKFATKITKDELLPGDMLLFHNPANPNNGSHVVLFGGWADETRTAYIAYEQTRPNTRKAPAPYGYWTNATKYVPYRFNGVTGGLVPETPSTDPKPAVPTAFPGTAKFGPGANNEYVAELGRMLIDRGGRRFYPKGAGTQWKDADRLATQAFQSAQGWTGTDADGIPGPHTWQLLTERKGNDIRPTVDAAPGPAGVSAYPGASVFRPGTSHPSIAALGRRLAKKGFGKNDTSGPGSRWSEAHRRNVEAFQRAQGWRGASANGYPGPETWRRLFA